MHLNICEDVDEGNLSKQAVIISGGQARMNETVVAKLLKLGYVRFVMIEHASLKEYAAFLTCLLLRPCQARNLILQVTREMASLSEARDSLRLLFSSSCLDALVRVLSRGNLEDLAVYYVGLTLQRLASASAECRMHLSTTGLPRVVVPQLLTANLRVRGVFLRLLEQIYGSPHIG